MERLKTKGLKLTYKDGYEITLYIYTKKLYTPFNYCVDHGSYYEIAEWSYYIRVDKKTMCVTSNQKNVNEYAPHNGITAEIIKISAEKAA